MGDIPVKDEKPLLIGNLAKHSKEFFECLKNQNVFVERTDETKMRNEVSYEAAKEKLKRVLEKIATLDELDQFTAGKFSGGQINPSTKSILMASQSIYSLAEFGTTRTKIDEK